MKAISKLSKTAWKMYRRNKYTYHKEKPFLTQLRRSKSSIPVHSCINYAFFGSIVLLNMVETGKFV